MTGRRIRRWAALALAAALLLLTACEQTEPAPTETPEATEPAATTAQRSRFTLAWDSSDTLNPLEAGSTNLTLSSLVCEGLFALDQSFSTEPVLCQSYAGSADGLTWTFTLRSGVTFSDGVALTAEHVADSLNAARTSSLYAARLAGVTSVTAGEGTVTITLSAPNGALPALLDLPVFRLNDYGVPIGTGPYCFAGSGDDFGLVRNPNWWQEHTLPLEEIALQEAVTADDRIAAFDTGLVTLVNTDLTGTNALGYSGNYETWDYPTTTMLFLGFNCAEGACTSADLRQAISRGVDRASVTVSLLSGHADEATLPVSPHAELYNETLAEELAYSLSAAEQLLTDGGYTKNDSGQLVRNGQPVTLTLLVNSENTFKTALADYLAEELGKLGLSVTVSRLPWDSYLAALEAGEFDLYLGQVRLTADFDLSALLTGALNYGGFQSAAVSALLSNFRAASGGARISAAYALYAQLASEMPFATLCFQRGSVLTQWGAVSGLSPTQQDPFYHIYDWTLS